jgi:hypothetical protein
LPITLKQRTYYRTAKTAVEKQAVEQLPTRSDARLPSPEDAGRKAWEAIHSHVGNCPKWLATWETSIPHFGCACKADYMQHKIENPPDLSSPGSFWMWGFDLHNWVNAKLGKPVISIEDAIKQWNPPFARSIAADQSSSDTGPSVDP